VGSRAKQAERHRALRFWDFDEEGSEPIAAKVRRPEKILPGHIQIAFGGFGILIASAAGIEIRHDGRHHEASVRAVQAKAHDLVLRRRPIGAAAAARPEMEHVNESVSAEASD
jgi:hypothetical protein